MTGETDDLFHARILPDHDLVLAVAVGADDLVAVLAPREVADLGARVDFLDEGASGRVPKLDGAISGAAAGGE